MSESKPVAVSPIQKGALLLIALGVEKASLLLKNLNDAQVEQIAMEIAKIQNVPPEVLNQVLEEYHQMIMTNQYTTQGGATYAKEILEKSLGAKKAKEILKRATKGTPQAGTLNLLLNMDHEQLLYLLQNEQPQTAALILAYLKPERAAAILSELPEESQYEIAYRLATIERTSPNLIEDIDAALRDQFGGTHFDDDLHKAGGAKFLAEILNSVNRNSEKNILTNLKERDAELASKITSFMFLFEDIINLDDLIIQTMLRKLDSRMLALALKGASSELRERIFKNMTERASATLKEEIEELGPVKLKEVEKAQKEIIEILLQLEEAGEIVLAWKEEDDDEIIE